MQRRSIMRVVVAPKQLIELYRNGSLFDAMYVYARWYTNDFEYLETVVPKKGRILDIGCGYGLFSNYLALRSKDRAVIGADLSTQRIRAAKKSVRGRTNIHFELEDANNLTTEKYDVMLMTDFLHHVTKKEQDRILRFASRNVKKKGNLIIKDIFRERSFTYFLYWLVDKYILNYGAHVRYFTKQEFLDKLHEGGFKVQILRNWKKLWPFEVILVCQKQ